ncbi:MAG: ComF family protein [bacterium]
MHQLNNISQALLDLIFPITCLGCQKEGPWLCADCCAKLPRTKNQCPFCNQPNNNSQTCPRCAAKNSLSGALSCFAYQHPLVKSLIHGAKYRYWKSILPQLAQQMAKKVEQNNKIINIKNSWVITPVPLHRSKHKIRGYNQSLLLAQGISAYLDAPLSRDLVRSTNTQAQAKLGKQARFANVNGVFSLKSNIDFSSKSVIIIDDVFTTGATLDSAARICQEHGAKKVWGLTFAHG